MEFIYKLYGNEYFGVILFSVIGILAFLFILILILGKIDEKKSKKAEKETAEDALKDVTPEAIALEAPVEISSAEPIMDIAPQVSAEEPVMEDMVEETAPVLAEEPQEEEVVEPITLTEENPFATNYIDLSEIERSLDSALEEPTMEEQPVVEEEKNEEISFFTPNFFAEEKETVTSVSTSEPTKVTPVQDQFSSVYVNPTVDVPTAKPVEETPAVSDMGFELPKRVEEPQKEVVEEQSVNEVPGLTMFPDIESETYDIKQ